MTEKYPDVTADSKQAPRSRSEAIRQQILDAAFQRFAHYGYQRTAMADIATAAAMSRPALYNHFRNKEEIFRALGQRISDDVVAAIEAAAQTPGSVADRLVAVMLARIEWMFELLNVSEHGRELVDEESRICGAAGQKANERFVAVLAHLLEQGARGGEVDPRLRSVRATKAAELLADAAGGVLAGEPSKERAADRLGMLVRIFVTGLRP
jgi:AcrR family transcriptional regulator